MTSVSRHSEAAFETAIEHHLLGHGYVAISRDGFDRERALFPSVVLHFIKETQPKEWAKREALHGRPARNASAWNVSMNHPRGSSKTRESIV